jgi:hypothetical protein
MSTEKSGDGGEKAAVAAFPVTQPEHCINCGLSVSPSCACARGRDLAAQAAPVPQDGDERAAARRLVQRHANAARALEHMYTEKNIARLKAVGEELEAALASNKAAAGAVGVSNYRPTSAINAVADFLEEAANLDIISQFTSIAEWIDACASVAPIDFDAWAATQKWADKYDMDVARIGWKAAIESTNLVFVGIAPLTVSQAPSSQYAEGWNDCLNAIVVNSPAPIASSSEAVAEVESWTNGSYHRNYKLRWLKDVEAGAKLYAAAQLSRAEVLEQAAKLCDQAFENVAPGHGGSYEEGCRDAFDLAGSQIRALKDQK